MKSPQQISVGFLRALLQLLDADHTYKGFNETVKLLSQERQFLDLGKFGAKGCFFIFLHP